VNVVILLALFGAFMSLAIYLALAALFKRSVNVQERIAPSEATANDTRTVWRRWWEHVLSAVKPLGEMIPRSPKEMSRQERRIVQAGIRRSGSAQLFIGFQVGTAILLVLVCGAAGVLGSHPFLSLAASALLGAMLPDLVLSRMISLRMERIQLGLPDALDLAVICVEAGLGLDQSLMRIGQEIRASHLDLSDELRYTNLEVTMGQSRANAYRHLGERTGVADLKSLCAVLIQTDRFGTSIGQALRVYSDALRVKRRQRAEERAAKLAVKMIPPLILFVFPAIFVVIVGPAIIAIAKDLLPTLAGQ
jgi:tight adherence protein C